MLDAATIGGVLLVLGASMTMMGNVYRAVLLYIVADFCWLYMAYTAGNTWGLVTVTAGTIMGFIAFLKMHRGHFLKSIVVSTTNLDSKKDTQ
ncbi:MAG: hypothetical protein ACN6OP_10365 [Pseudomonadales bacterium]